MLSLAEDHPASDQNSRYQSKVPNTETARCGASPIISVFAKFVFLSPTPSLYKVLLSGWSSFRLCERRAERSSDHTAGRLPGHCLARRPTVSAAARQQQAEQPARWPASPRRSQPQEARPDWRSRAQVCPTTAKKCREAMTLLVRKLTLQPARLLCLTKMVKVLSCRCGVRVQRRWQVITPLRHQG